MVARRQCRRSFLHNLGCIMKLDLLAKFLLASALALCQLDTQAASQAPVGAEHGMVVTAQHLATHVGVDVLKAGGNAVDAAVAVGYALAVVYPAAGNLGGGGFMTIQLADGRKTFLDFREKAPLAAAPNMVISRGISKVAFRRSISEAGICNLLQIWNRRSGRGSC